MNREEAIEIVKKLYNDSLFMKKDKEAVLTLIPEITENEDERIIRAIIDALYSHSNSINLLSSRGYQMGDIETWLEKQKEANKATEAVERIDKYIDENLANAHDMKDSDPDKKYYSGWDDALGKMSGILQDVYSGEKKKESLRDFIDNFPYSAEQEEHQNNSDAPNESSWAGMISSSDKDKNLDEIAQDYVDGVKEYNSEPTWDLIQTAVCYGYHLGANHQVLDDEHLLSAIQVQFASHAKVENGKRYAKLTWDEFKKIIFELYSCNKQKEQKPAEWNEEDLQHRQWILECLADGERKVPEFAEQYQAAFNWLKSLPERFNLQPKQEWSEEDKDMRDTIIRDLKRLGGDIVNVKPAYKAEVDWLKSLHPQPKEELTLLDENIITAAVAFVDLNPYNCWCGIDKNTVIKALRSLHPQSKIHYWTEEEIEPIISDYLTGKEHYGGMIARLRCLKPKSSWRPSVEQMNTLLNVEGILRFLQYNKKAKILAELYEQLKKHFKSLLI